MADQGESSPIRWPGLVALALAAIGGLFWARSTLRSSRPSAPEYRVYRALGDQVVDARLWQDPFEVVATFDKAAEGGNEKKAQPASKTRKPPRSGTPSSSGTSTNSAAAAESSPTALHTPASVAEQILRHMSNSSPTNGEVVVSLQMVSGGPYPEDWENRLRARNAVISALGRAGYAPFDEEHIGYFTLPWHRGAWFEVATNNLALPLTNSEPGGTPLTIPFEWFQPSEFRLAVEGGREPSKQVLVCWLEREAFQDHPLKRLAQLITSLRPEAPDDASRVRFQLFDPGLRDMLSELQGPAFSPPKKDATNNLAFAKVLANLQIYSAWSTTADALLTSNVTTKRREAIRDIFDKHGIAFTNLAVTDDELAERLLEELRLRGVDVRRTNQSVALISEWDTAYGRALPLTFAARVVQRQSEPTNSLAAIFKELRTNEKAWPTNLLRFTYLRGVDGKVPGASKEEKPTTARNRGQEKEEMERPEGCSQLDYIPRLVVELIEREREMRHGLNSGIRAIGVLGSDVYDKLLLIQALRDRFPGKLFFTVDLDARLFHPSELEWSCNLLVASGFDLELGEELQDPIPPFRDSYQTGRFLACLAALGVVTNDLSQIQARMFEVGHHGAYVLDVGGESNKASPFYSVRLPCLSCLQLLAAAAALVLGFVLLLIFSRQLRDWVAGRLESAPPHSRWVALGAVLLLAGAVWYIRADDARPEGEPFSLFEGISVWPAELIRLAAVFIGWGLLAKQIRKLNLNTASLRKEFKLHQNGDPTWISLRPEAQKELCRAHPCVPQRLMKYLAPFLIPTWISLRHEERMELCDAHPCVPQRLTRRLAPFLIWRPRQTWDDADDEKAEVKADELWRHYERWGRLENRVARVIPAMVVFVGIPLLLMLPFGLPFRPIRGPYSDWADLAVLIGGIATQVFLTFFVVDAVRACRWFIDDLGAHPTKWPEELLKNRELAFNMDKKYLDEWLDIELIGQRTQEVGKLIYYPFIVLALMIVSRNTYFERWDWPLSLVLVIGIISAYALSCAIGLRRAAEKVRRKELERLRSKLLGAIGELDSHHPEQLRRMIEDIESLRKGVFAPLSEQPFFRATLVILGGAGSLPLAGYLPSLLGLLQ